MVWLSGMAVVVVAGVAPVAAWLLSGFTVSQEDSRIALGQTREGRYLRVVYVPDPLPDSVFVITAFELGPKAKHALRRRRRRKT